MADRDGSGDTRSESGIASTPLATQQQTMQDKLAPVDRTGERFGRYRVLARLGEGGMGVVYAALDPALDRRVALKVLPALAEDRRAHFEARLRREAQALARLEHPNVVRVYDVGVAEHSVFVAMQLVDGTNLAEYVKATRPEMRDLLVLLAAAGRGLAAAHEAGIVHRDVKASNIFVDKRGAVFVGDFGLARGTDEVDVPAGSSGNDLLHADMTRAGAVLGTPAYMSPEQHRGDAATARSDQFSYCVAAWELLFDAHPFTDGAWTQAAIMAMASDEVREPARGGVPARVVRALRRGLRSAPEARWPSLKELVDEIEPRSRAGWLWAAAAGTGMIGVAAATAVLAGGTPSDTRTCDAAVDRLDAIWPRDAKKLGDALAAAGLDGEGKLAGALDEWAAAWRTARRATCDAADRTPVMRELQAQCLDDALRVFADFVGELPDAKRSVLTTAHDTVRHLPRVGDCSVNALAAMPPVPAHALVGVSDTRRLLGQARTKLFTGQVEASTKMIARAVVAAGELAYAPLTAEAAFTEAELLFQTDDPRAGQAASQAAEVATTARADRLAAQAYALALVDAANRPDPARIDVLTPVARAAANRVGEPFAVAQAAHAAAAGARAMSKLDDALASCEQSQAQIERISPGGERDIVEDETAGCFTAVYVARADTPSAVKWAEKWLAIAARRYGTDTLGSLPPIRELASLRFSEGKTDAAIALQKRALAITERALGAQSEQLLDDLSSLSQMLSISGRTGDALAVAQRAVPLVAKIEANGSLRKRFIAKMTLAELYKMTDRAMDSARAYEAALALADQLPPDDDHVATARMIVGMIYVEGGELEEGDQLIAKAAASWTRTRSPRRHVANAMRGEILVRAQKCDRAVPVLEAAITGMEQQPSDRANLIRARMKLASCLSEGDIPRGQVLARGVLADAAALGSAGNDLVGEAKAWLAFHQPSVGRTGATQWASRVRDVSSEYGNISWSAQQALGAPDTYPVDGDARTAWASKDEDGETEFIEVGFAEPAPAAAIAIYETFNPGAVTLVEIITASGRREVYRGKPSPLSGARINTIAFPGCTSEAVIAVRITLSSRAVPGWNEIDAVGAVACP